MLLYNVVVLVSYFLIVVLLWCCGCVVIEAEHFTIVHNRELWSYILY